jgi:hypothetical protein
MDRWMDGMQGRRRDGWMIRDGEGVLLWFRLEVGFAACADEAGER